MTPPFIDPKSGNWLMRWRRNRIGWHRKRGHRVECGRDLLGLPMTLCWDCCMSWKPVWGTGDTLICYHPKPSTLTELLRRTTQEG